MWFPCGQHPVTLWGHFVNSYGYHIQTECSNETLNTEYVKVCKSDISMAFLLPVILIRAATVVYLIYLTNVKA